MPSLSFSDEFKKKVRCGSKTQTIRSLRKRPFKVGDTIYLFSKLRTKHCERLGEGICTEVINLKFVKIGCVTFIELPPTKTLLSRFNEIALAERDGFETYGSTSAAEMRLWFEKRYGVKRYQMKFQIIRWKLR